MSLFKTLVASAVGGAALIGIACAGTISNSQATGVTTLNDPNSGRSVARIDLGAQGLENLLGVKISSGGLNNTGGGNLSGFDLDTLFVSNVDCASYSCVKNSVEGASFIDTSNLSFMGGGSGGERLVGTSSIGGLDNAVATLTAFDGSGGQRSGFVSLGVGGMLEAMLSNTLANLDGLFLYIVEVGGQGREIQTVSVDLLFEDVIETPIPGALPLMLSALFGWGVFARRRKGEAE